MVVPNSQGKSTADESLDESVNNNLGVDNVCVIQGRHLKWALIHLGFCGAMAVTIFLPHLFCLWIQEHPASSFTVEPSLLSFLFPEETAESAPVAIPDPPAPVLASPRSERLAPGSALGLPSTPAVCLTSASQSEAPPTPSWWSPRPSGAAVAVQEPASEPDSPGSGSPGAILAARVSAVASGVAQPASASLSAPTPAAAAAALVPAAVVLGSGPAAVAVSAPLAQPPRQASIVPVADSELLPRRAVQRGPLPVLPMVNFPRLTEAAVRSPPLRPAPPPSAAAAVAWPAAAASSIFAAELPPPGAASEASLGLAQPPAAAVRAAAPAGVPAAAAASNFVRVPESPPPGAASGASSEPVQPPAAAAWIAAAAGMVAGWQVSPGVGEPVESQPEASSVAVPDAQGGEGSLANGGAEMPESCVHDMFFCPLTLVRTLHFIYCPALPT